MVKSITPFALNNVRTTACPLLKMSLGAFSWLSQFTRAFKINGRNVEVIYSPINYFEALKLGVQSAQNRIVFSSLYLGTGKREVELVNAFHEALSDSSRPALKCTLVLDYLRGSRGGHNSRSMVQTLVNEFDGRFQLCLYHTPNLRGFLKWVGPERFNEVMGLQHMKVYIFDNNLLISGANLSRDYFVDRQDRYILFKNCPELTDFFADLVSRVADHSFSLQRDGSTKHPKAFSFDPLSSRRRAQQFRMSLANAVKELIQPSDRQPEIDVSPCLDTVVYPLVQMGYYGIHQDELATQRVLSHLNRTDHAYLASGYFNLPPQYIDAIFRGQGTCHVLAASPQANGFYGGKGVAGHVPMMYVHFARNFLKAVDRHGYQDRIKYLEYYREGWTFHGKGLWHYSDGEAWPSLTLMGSTNYGHRSLTRDLEVQIAMATTNVELKQALHKERTEMYRYCSELNLTQATNEPSRRLSLWEWVATSLLKPHV